MVELYGQKGWQKREYDEDTWNHQRNRIKGPFYSGMDRVMAMPEFNLRLNAPTSLSVDVEVMRGLLIHTEL